MSVELQKLRQELLREALLKGWTKASDVPASWTQQVENQRIERWYRKLYRAADGPLPVGPRLVNHFKLGADPEFVFHDGTHRIDAGDFGMLKAGPAFGADNNNRLVELRPKPSRSALSVLASLWLAMRWMVVYQPQVLQFHWRSGSYFGGDGLGGHVHFGRKRLKLRDREVGVLDRLTHLLFVANIFDREEGRMRVRQAQGAPAGQPYGALGDVRVQPHGYEYRTMPSWIDDVWLAYFNLVVAKLVVAFPDLVAPLTEADGGLSPEQARQQLRMLLAYFGPLDDDARLAFAILNRRGMPHHVQGLDFKNNWGLFADGPFGRSQEALAPDILPESLEPSPEEEQELAMAMFEARPPELLELKPSWQPYKLPVGYCHSIRMVNTKVAPGLGEFAMGLCTHNKAKFALGNMGHSSYAFNFSSSYQGLLRRTKLLEKLGVPGLAEYEGQGLMINASKDFSTEQLLLARQRIVESGLFPLWDIRTVKESSYEEWSSQKLKGHPGYTLALDEGRK